MKSYPIKQMEDWEEEVDNFNWQTMLSEIDQALIENLAAELGFPSYEKLEHASELVVDQYYICHLSDGRWAWWNPEKYAKEDPLYFHSKEEVEAFIADFLGLEKEEEFEHLRKGLDQVVQTKRCHYCEHEFNPSDPDLYDWDTDKYCSAECAMDAVMKDMKEEFVE